MNLRLTRRSRCLLESDQRNVIRVPRVVVVRMHRDLLDLKVFFLHTKIAAIAFVLLLSIDVAQANQSS